MRVRVRVSVEFGGGLVVVAVVAEAEAAHLVRVRVGVGVRVRARTRVRTRVKVRVRVLPHLEDVACGLAAEGAAREEERHGTVSRGGAAARCAGGYVDGRQGRAVLLGGA